MTVKNTVKTEPTLITEHDIYLFKEGKHYRLYEKLGSHVIQTQDTAGTYFAVWAPNAGQVSVIGEFNDWNPDSHKLNPRWDGSGIWEGFIPGLDQGHLYKYRIRSKHNGHVVDKADPYAFQSEMPPATASRVRRLEYKWSDEKWMKDRHKVNSLKNPISIYEVHLGSWQQKDNGDSLNYREIAKPLAEHVKKMGFTHVEFMPVMEHPFYGSWGYQVTGFFAPTSRYGQPEDLMYLVDYLHQYGIAVILDWVPSHFPADEHGLVYFDGTHLYEHADPRQGFHPDWNSWIFNYGRHEVRAFLISSAFFWLDKYHVDGLRVDGVASMLYLDYSRNEGEWIPNEYGGRENLEAISFLRHFNEAVYGAFPDVQTIAEESTSYPMVSRPSYVGGLGFGMKWNMGWMHDTLEYMTKDPIHRIYHHDKLTFSIWYAFSENFVLPFSHDEVVHGKGSLLGKMPGDQWQKFANLRLMLGYMFTHPGKKHLFMGAEIGQAVEWNHDAQLDWPALQSDFGAGLAKWVSDINTLYKNAPALYEMDFDSAGFEWIDFHDIEKSVLSYIRYSKDKKQSLAVVCNFTPIPRYNYKVGVPEPGFWKEVLNSDAKEYAGSGQGNTGGTKTMPVPFYGRFDQSLSVTLPPLGIVVFKKEET